MKQWNSNGGTVRWNSVVEKWNIVWWNSKTVMVEQCGGTVEHRWWNSVMKQWSSVMKQWNSVMKQWNSIGGTVWGHSGTVRWNSGTVMPGQ